MADKKKGNAATEQSVSFEEATEQLAAIVDQLESGELRLEESLGLFEKGVAVARTAQQQLDAAERRVEELLAVDEQGRTKTRDFE